MQRLVLFLVLVIFCGGLAGPSLSDPSLRVGYLAPDALDILAVLPPAPVPGDPRYDADRQIFRITRGLKGTPRWVLATSDVKTSVPDLMQDFSCAAGVELTPSNAPHLAALVVKAAADTSRETNIAKDHDKRLRPFQIDDGEICQAKSDLAGSYDYPSGHTTWGWTWATILAELIPERTTQILARGRAYGESRIVCGAHNASAVWAGWLSASVTLTAVRATPAYRADFEAAKSELDTLRSSPNAVRPQKCDEEAELVGEDILKPAPH